MIAPFLLYVPVGIAVLAIFVPASTFVVNDWVQYLYFLPTFPFEVILVSIFSPEMKEQLFSVDVSFSWFCLIAILPVYLLLHIYFEAIIPDSYGVTSSCCFCLRWGKTKEAHEHEQQQEEIDDNAFDSESARDSEYGEDQLIDDESREKFLTDAQRKDRENEARKAYDKTDPIKLKELTMQFGDLKAVDGLSLSIKKDEIIALLGHNGAGKTTAIYMLTGMLMPTKGDAVLNGNSIVKDTDAVRRQLGLCQQHDVLYDQISVEEHLRLVMRIRTNKVDEAEEEETIASILRETMLTDHR